MKIPNNYENDKASREWLNSQKKSTMYVYKSWWKFFLEFTGMTGDDILASKKKDTEYAWEQKVLDFKKWMIEKKDFAEQSAVTAAATVRGFFAYHRNDLNFRPSETRRLSEGKQKYEDYRFSRDDLKKISDVADLTEQYVIVVGKSFGLRAGDFLRITRGDLEAYIDREPPISIGKYDTQKRDVAAYPFIDRDAKPVVKLVLEKMDREGRTEPSERMLEYKFTIELSRIVRRAAKRAGIKHGNKRIRFHCLRKFLTDRLSSFMSESKWKQVVGKKISEGAYVSPDLLRKDYERAMSETCFTRPQLISKEVVQKEVITALKEAATGMTTDDLLKPIAERYGVKVEVLKKSLIKGLGEAKEDSQEKYWHKKKPPAHDCQKIVEESELGEYLAQGWHAVMTLPSGKIVISNE